MPVADEERLADELSAVTELPVETGDWPHVKLPVGATAQRLALERDATDDVRLSIWPAELKDQAGAFYGSPDKVDATLELCRTTRWDGTPNGHLSYWLADRGRRWYFRGGRLPLGAYLSQWVEDLDRVHAYTHDAVRNELWPWLVERGYAGGVLDRNRMHAFLDHARPEVHLRPSVWLSHRWGSYEVDDLDRRGELRQAVKREVDRVLNVLEEPLST